MKLALEVIFFLTLGIVGYVLWGIGGIIASILIAVVSAGLSLLGLGSKLITLLALLVYGVTEHITGNKNK